MPQRVPPVLVLAGACLAAFVAPCPCAAQDFAVGKDESPSPDDRVLDPKYHFPAPAAAAMERCYRTLHRLSEVKYLGAGVWGEMPPGRRPDLRESSRRVHAYLDGWARFGDPVFRQRAVEGLDYLVRVQDPGGFWRWYSRGFEGLSRDDGIMFETGIAGAALVRGFRLLKDDRHLAASKRAVEWALRYPACPNNNYNMFVVWHLAEHYDATKDARALERAVAFTREAGLTGQLPSGGWPGHNSFVWYHAIILRGASALYRVMPPDHPYRPELRRRIVAAVNHLLKQQNADGSLGPSEHGYSMLGLLEAERALGAPLDDAVRGVLACTRREAEALEPGIARAEQAPRTEDPIPPPFTHTPFDGFEEYDPPAASGVVARDWFPCWHPGFDPKEGEVTYARDEARARSGKACQAVRFTNAKVDYNGLARTIPEALLRRGRRYSVIAWMRADEDEGARGRQPVQFITVAPTADADRFNALAARPMSEDAVPGAWRQLRFDFVPLKPGPYRVYLWAQVDPLPAGASVTVCLDDLALIDWGPAPPARPFLPELDTEFQGLGAWFALHGPARVDGGPQQKEIHRRDAENAEER